MAKKLSAKGKSKGNRFDRIVITGIIISLIAIALTLWGPLRKFRVAEEKAPPVQTQKREAPPKKSAKNDEKEIQARTETKQPKKHAESMVLGPIEKTVQIAIVIDDLGMDMKQAREILSLPGKITLAVMPGLAQSKKIAGLARQNKHEVLLHLPMDYRSTSGKPAAGMLHSNMTPRDFLTTVSDDVESVPGAVGVNNHEGSALTENKEAMKFLMAELKARNLFFLDSVTSAKSVAYSTAKEFGLKTGKRDVFLDNEGDNAEYIRGQLQTLLDTARKHGRAIGIGHPHPVTIIELRKWLNEAKQQGIEIVPVSRLMN